MSLTIEDFKGKYEPKSLSEFERVLEKRYGPDVNGFWISHDEKRNPAISLLVKGDLSYILYFPDENHPGFASVGRIERLDRDGFTTFRFETVEQEQEVWNRQVIPLTDALKAAVEFFTSEKLPQSIEWEEL
jgi:hypothetical protein